MDAIRIEDIKKWRANRIASGQCSFDDMTALNGFLDNAERVEFTLCTECRFCREQGGHANCGGYLYCKRQRMMVTETSGCTWGEER